MTWTQFVQSLRKGLAERARKTMASQSTPQRAAAVRAIAIESHQPQVAIQSASRCQPMEEWSYYLVDVSYNFGRLTANDHETHDKTSASILLNSLSILLFYLDFQEYGEPMVFAPLW